MKARTLTPYLTAVLVAERLLELRIARANERWARERGAVEHGREHYPAFFVLHPLWLVCTVLEGRANGGRVNVPALLAAAAAQALRYWTIRTLGHYWNTRILIVPGGQRVTGGPFRYVTHPNYAAVVLELAAVPLSVGAWRTALVFSIANALLLGLVRIPAENRALEGYAGEGGQTV